MCWYLVTIVGEETEEREARAPRGDFMSENWGWGIVLTMEAVLVSVATWEILLVVWGRSMAATWDQVRPANLTRLLILLTFIGFQNK